MAQKTIKLSRRYEVPGGVPFDEVTLREPTYRDIYMSGLGEPRETHWVKDKPIVVTQYEVIDQYLQRLAVVPDYSAIAVLDAVDALAVGEAVCGFFTRSTA
ncbi:hypothetical protein H4S14_000805 [Agrobacterium vitis]|nr:hypothetical protein [Agrobacterium vitis]MBE1437078.1 hypothetical protein [Agrobacterium vitis]